MKKKKKSRAKAKGKPSAVELEIDCSDFAGISIESYENAVDSISWLLAHPKAVEGVLSSIQGKLLYYQALLMEFRICPDQEPLPSSLRTAKIMLSTMVHINIADYIECRGKGPEALQAKMLSSKTALRKDVMSSKQRRLPLDQIKKKGLRILLATVWHN